MTVVKFPAPATTDEGRINELIDSLKENLDELIFIKVEQDGEVAIGHTPLSKAGAAVMFYRIQGYLAQLMASSEQETYH